MNQHYTGSTTILDETLTVLAKQGFKDAIVRVSYGGRTGDGMSWSIEVGKRHDS